jgi:AcrR family transcriptional regulator
VDSEPAQAGRRERKTAATRAHVSDTALGLFLEKGFENVTVRDVASAADVSPTTLLNHVATKEALVVDRGRASTGASPCGLPSAMIK